MDVREFQPYSALEHIAQSLYLGRAINAPDSCWFAMLSAYFDDSGKHAGKDQDTPSVVFSGFVSTLDQWRCFERDWQFVMQMPHIDLDYFHMKELRAYKGRFAKFKDNLALQADLFDRMIRVLRIRTIRPFAGVVIRDAYNRVNEEFNLDDLGPPSMVAALMAIGRLMTWKRERYPDVEIQVVVDQGIDHFGKLDDEVLRRYGFRLIPAFVSKTPPLQGCDFVAWEQHRAAALQVDGAIQSWSDYRKSFLAIMERLGANEEGGVSWYYLDEARLREACDDHQVPRREVVPS